MDDLDALVRRVDEDRWLASRFAPADVRRRLIALYALNYEIARTAETVTQGAIGDIRLAWWREAAAEIFEHRSVRKHPIVEAFAASARETAFSRGTLELLIEARGKDLDAAPFATWSDLDAYVDATAGGLMRLAMEASGEAVNAALAGAAGRAWGFVGLLRAAPFWRTRARRLFPAGVSDEDGAATLRERARTAHEEARRLSREAPSALFPAIGYAALVPGYLRHETRPLLLRQVSLITASAAGRV